MIRLRAAVRPTSIDSSHVKGSDAPYEHRRNRTVGYGDMTQGQ